MPLRIRFATTWLPHSDIFQIRKQIDMPEVIGVAKEDPGGLHPPIEMPPMVKKDENKVYCLFNLSFFLAFLRTITIINNNFIVCGQRA